VRDDFICSGAPPNSAEMRISLNGETVDTREAKTIAELIDRYQLLPQAVLVEHNGLALHRQEWSERPISEGDRIEFIRVVAGG
jgi:sulfur carrier protein